MTWVVKCRGQDGKITSTPMNDFQQAFELRNKLMLSKGNYAWIEDAEGRLCGFTVISDPQ